MSCFPHIWAPTELSWFTVAMSGLISLIATAGNLIIIVMFAIDPIKKLRSPFNYFLVNLAVSDLIVGGFTMTVSVWAHYKGATGHVPPALPKLLHMSFLISASASLLSLISLSIDRLIAINWAIKYRQYLSWNRCYITSFVIWLISITIPFVHFKWNYLAYLMFYANTAVLVGLLVMIGIYLRVYRFLREQTKKKRDVLNSKEKQNLKRLDMEKKVTQTLFVILIVFIFTYVPSIILIYILHFCKSCGCMIRHICRDGLFLLVSSNSCVNPFICTIRLKHFQKSIKAIFNRVHKVKVKSKTTKEDASQSTSNIV